MNSAACRVSQLLKVAGRSVSSFTKFDEYLSIRRRQAAKTLLIQVANLNSAHDLRSYLQSTFGPLQALYHYTIPGKSKSSGISKNPLDTTQRSLPSGSGDYHWLLAEFSSEEAAAECISSTRHAEGTLPYKSALCWAQELKTSRTNQTEDEVPELLSHKLNSEGNPDFRNGKTLSEQLHILETSTKITELGTRTRFFVASQLEQAFGKLFPRCCILPFGSTVSGIGRQAGDLDLVLVPNLSEIFPEIQDESSGRLFSQSKLYAVGNTSNTRFQAQRVMETIADVIQLLVPGCTHVQRILQARVPILRFRSEFTNLQCDLSMTNSSGVHMSELIYLMSQLEPRFSTLLFAIRSWASARKITNSIPGRQPTNFMFALLLIYFLQQRQLLPTLDILFNNAGARDQRLTADGLDCSFLHDKEQILKHFTQRSQDESIVELLIDFFKFYSEFDFAAKGVSLVTGVSWGKPDSGPLYIQNPLERHLNVARNVSKEEVSRFKSECCSAIWKLETSPNVVQSTDKDNGLSVTLKELLTPTLGRDGRGRNSPAVQRLQVKELFTK